MKATIAADPQELRAIRPVVHALADAVDAITTRLGAALDAEGRCWGADEWGTAFAATYTPVSGAIRSLLGGTGAAIDEFATALSVVADVFAAADDQARRHVA